MHGIRRYYLRFDVQSHVFISTFRAVVSVWRSKPWFWVDIQSYYIIHFGVQSHYSSSLQHSEPLLIFIRCSEPCLLHLAFKATSSFSVQSHYIIHFGVQSHYPSSLQHSDPLLIFVRRSKPCLLYSALEPRLRSAFRAITSSISAFRVITHLRYSIQSHYLSSFGIQSHVLLHSTFRPTSSFGVQSHYIIHFGVQSY